MNKITQVLELNDKIETLGAQKIDVTIAKLDNVMIYPSL